MYAGPSIAQGIWASTLGLRVACIACSQFHLADRVTKKRNKKKKRAIWTSPAGGLNAILQHILRSLLFKTTSHHNATHLFLGEESISFQTHGFLARCRLGKDLLPEMHCSILQSNRSFTYLLERHLYCTYYLVPVKAVYGDHKEEIIFMLLLVCYKFRNNFAWTADLWINNKGL